MKGILKFLIALVFIINFSFFPNTFAMNKANYVININNATSYYIWLRAKAPFEQSSTINVQIDGGVASSLVFTDSENFSWKKTSIPNYLSTGSHKIELQSSNQGTYIDKLIITSDNGYIPIGEGAAATNPSSIPSVWKAISHPGKGGMPIMMDVNNDDKTDFVITGYDYLSVYDNSGAMLWESQISSAKLSYVGEGANYCRPSDIDNDGNVEVVGLICINNVLYLAAIDAVTGTIKTQLALSALSNDWYYDATQVANLRGLSTPQDFIIKSGVNGYVPFKLMAYKFENGQFQLMWQFVSQAGETRAACHRPKVFDIDMDGYDEILFGHWLLEENGTVKWEKPFGFFDSNTHIDSHRAGDFMPSNPGFEIAYASGSVVLDSLGNVLWRKDIAEGQSVAIAEMRPDLPGLELLIAYQEPYNDERMFSCNGDLLWTFDGQPHYAASYETYPIQWIGDVGKESVRQEWGRDRSPSIYDEYNNLVVRLTPEYDYGEIGYRPCDVTGDYREELVCFNSNYTIIYENIAPNSRFFPSPWNDPIYKESQYNWEYY